MTDRQYEDEDHVAALTAERFKILPSRRTYEPPTDTDAEIAARQAVLRSMSDRDE